ncbi:MAG: Hint domain-containing protein [Pseudomonadota bacterium]
MRKYEVAYLAGNGDGASVTRLAPANAMFEAPFMALARGTLITTPDGPVAVEDLQPGMLVQTVDGGPEKILWKGATTMVPGAPGQSEEAGQFTRIAADSMGLARPTHDLLLGFGARVFRHSHRHMISAPMLVDGEAAFSIRPQSPVRVFHFALARHAILSANGIEVESFHPGIAPRLLSRPEVNALYLSLFPHLTRLEEFGPMRFPREDLELGMLA